MSFMAYSLGAYIRQNSSVYYGLLSQVLYLLTNNGLAFLWSSRWEVDKKNKNKNVFKQKITLVTILTHYAYITHLLSVTDKEYIT